MFILLLALIGYTHGCFHKGCEMSPGLRAQDLTPSIAGVLKRNEYNDNVIRAVSWDLFASNGTDQKQLSLVCSYLQSLMPTVLALQDVHLSDLRSLQQCLDTYETFGVDKYAITNKHYNVIMYKQEARLKLVDSGRFYLSITPRVEGSKLPGAKKPTTCVWARFTFAVRKHDLLKNFVSRAKPKISLSGKLFHLLKLFTNKITWSYEDIDSSDYPEASYQWTDFYVATTQLDQHQEKLAADQAQILKLYLRNYVTERRRYPVIVMGDFAWDDLSPVYGALNRAFWLNNTLAASRLTLPHFTLGDSKLVDFVWQYKFKSLVSGVMNDSPIIYKHKPVVAALLNTLK